VIAELTKLRTVRATPWTLVAFVVGSAGLAYLLGLSMRHSLPDAAPDRRADFDPLFVTFLPLTIGQMALVVLGALAVTSEYSSGTIRASLAAVPRRSRFYAAKVAAVSGVAATASVVTVAVTFAVAQVGLGPYGTSIGSGDALRASVGACVHLTLMCAFATGVAAMLRHTGLVLGVLLPVLFLGSQGLGNIPAIRKVTQFLPDQVGWVIMHLAGSQDDPRWARDYGPWTGLGLLVLWTAASLLGGYWVLRRRDA
jgi:ABC-2 type transport system permease protein